MVVCLDDALVIHDKSGRLSTQSGSPPLGRLDGYALRDDGKQQLRQATPIQVIDYEAH